MAKWADEFFVEWQRAWTTSTDAVLEHVTDDVEYWDVTLAEPLRGRAEFSRYVDGFFRAFTEIEWSLREPVIAEQGKTRVTEPWRFRGVNSGPMWIGLPATGRRVETIGTDIFEFREGKVCREHSFYDVTSVMRQLGLWPAVGSAGERAAMRAGSLAIKARGLVSRG